MSAVCRPSVPPWTDAPWTDAPSTARMMPSDSDPPSWICPSLLPTGDMRSAEPPLPPCPPPEKMDFFHKLGYSTAQVRSIQRKFGAAASDTDKILGELVRIRPPGPVTVSVLLPQGDALRPPPGTTLQVPVPAGAAPPLREEGGVGGDEEDLRPIVIDGSNVAMSHGNKEVFSCLGIQLAVNYFLDRGHGDVTVFVPSWRKEQPRPDVPITDQHILRDLERRKILVFTPSRRVAGKRVVCNDDCFIVKHGFESDGIVVSNDMYRDLQGEKPEWKRFIEERLLMYSFVNNKFMPPDDPLGRHGPTLKNFLRKFPKTPKKHPCPYGKKCTYGIKCKFHHPERAKQSNRLVADELRENAKHPSSTQIHLSSSSSPEPGQSLLLVEDMAKKLTLGHEGSSSKKDHKSEHVSQVKSHRTSKKSTTKKEKSSHRSVSSDSSVSHGESHEQLDSGLGSIDSQTMEAPWSLCDYQYAPTFMGGQHVHNVRQPPRSAPCSCCSHGSLGTAPAFPSHPHNIRAPGSHRHDMIPPGLSHYPGYGAYPVSVPAAYSHPGDFQHGRVHKHQLQAYWSDPFVGHSPAVRGHLPERRQWEPPQSNPGREERDVVRKKLLAIFSASLVDTAMDMFPQVMDPQVLVAEILVLQSQNPSLR